MFPARLVAGFALPVLLLVCACAADQHPADGPPPAAAPAAPTSGQPAGPAVPPAPGEPGGREPGGSQVVPVYYVGDTAAGFRLYREFRRVGAGDPASAAAREMFARDRGLDPDYRSFWPAGTTLHSPVGHAGGVITVDLTAQAGDGQAGAELEAMSIQQLVYTVQGALQSTDPVQLLVEGERVDELWGHVAVREPISRADPYTTRSLVQINDPNEGATVAGTFTVSGEAAAFEANVPWEVLRDGEVVRSGFTTAQGGQRFSAFGFPLTLEPGEYVVRVVEDDPSGGEGRPPFEDTKRIRVGG